MGITGIGSSQSSIRLRRSSQSSQDSYENNIKKQISSLEEKVQNISNDEEKPVEEKKKEKQAAQEKLQNLNQELREYQIRKRQEEAEEKREAVKEALKSANEADNATNPGNTNAAGNATNPGDTNEAEKDTLFEGFGSKEAGVMITLSTAKEQLAGMVRLRTSLEGRQRTATTDEEKAALQKKINRVSKGIGQKVISATDTISDFRKNNTAEDKKKQPKAEPKREEAFWTDTKPISAKNSAISGKQPNLGKNKLFHGNVSYSIK